jgi:hypothetical protein
VLLPPDLFSAAAGHVAHHHCWHVARRPGQELLRAKLPGECRPTLAGLDEVGSGCDFLAFHRRMMRHFSAVLESVGPSDFEFLPWTGHRLPEWVERQLLESYPDFDLPFAYDTLMALTNAGDIEGLGAFIEPNQFHSGARGAGLHNRLHMAIGAFEASLYAGDQTAPMRDIGRSPGNVFFWTLHSWIDDLYAECQQACGETPDRSPQQMKMVHVSCKGTVPLLI